MQKILSTTPESLGAGDRTRLVIQNLGPGLVYLDTEGSVSATDGLQIVVGAVYEFAVSSSTDDVWVVASVANTDVRVVKVG